jgi:hypothetical protein
MRQNTDQQKAKKSLKITQRFSNGRSGDAPAVDGLQPQRHFSRFGRRVFDHLSFIETDAPPSKKFVTSTLSTITRQ